MRIIVVLTVINCLVLVGMVIVGDAPTNSDTISLSNLIQQFFLRFPHIYQ